MLSHYHPLERHVIFFVDGPQRVNYRLCAAAVNQLPAAEYPLSVFLVADILQAECFMLNCSLDFLRTRSPGILLLEDGVRKVSLGVKESTSAFYAGSRCSS